MPNRLLCTVFDEMRECVKTSNFSYLSGLIEEAQSLGNRMESHLYDIKDLNRLHKDIKALKKKKKKLKEEVEEVEEVEE
jgi:cell shape-determining protein MreC